MKVFWTFLCILVTTFLCNGCFRMSQFVSQPTQFTVTSATLIDVVVTDLKVSISKSEVDKEVRSKRNAKAPTANYLFKNYRYEDEENSSEENELTSEAKAYMRGYVTSLLENEQYSRHRDHRRRWNRRYRDDDDRNRDYKPSRRRSHNRNYVNNTGKVWTSEVTGTFGKKVNITDPPYSEKWNCPDSPTMIELKPDGVEYGIVKDLTERSWKTLLVLSIDKIEKITNQCLWKKYRYRKAQISNDLGQDDVTETLLFYEPNDSETSHEEQLQAHHYGFDERDLTIHSSQFGAALMFTRFVRPFLMYRSRPILLCRVALGNVQTVKWHDELAHAPVGFHSVTKDDDYAIYRGEQVYPEYRITYHYITEYDEFHYENYSTN